MLGYSVRKLLLTKLNVINSTDRDSYSYKTNRYCGIFIIRIIS